MHPFVYAAPDSVDEAVRLLAGGTDISRPLAGGTDLITQLREGRREADLVVDLKRIERLNSLAFDAEQGLCIGAALPFVRLQESTEVRTHYPVLATIPALIGSYQIQNRASLGGNLCNSSPSADGIPPLIVLNAQAVIAGPGGERVLPVNSFCTGPGKNVLEPGEILVELRIPSPPMHSGSAYQRFTPRNEMDIAVAGAAACVAVNGKGEIQWARIALAAVASVPLRVPEAEALLQGQTPSEALFAKAGAAAAAACTPISDVRGSAEYRRHLVGVLTRRTLTAALAQAEGGN